MSDRQPRLLLGVVLALVLVAAAQATDFVSLTKAAQDVGGALKIDGKGLYTVGTGRKLVEITLIADDGTNTYMKAASTIKGDWSGIVDVPKGKYNVSVKMKTEDAGGKTYETDGDVVAIDVEVK